MFHIINETKVLLNEMNDMNILMKLHERGTGLGHEVLIKINSENGEPLKKQKTPIISTIHTIILASRVEIESAIIIAHVIANLLIGMVHLLIGREKARIKCHR